MLKNDPRVVQWARAWVDRITAREAATSPTRQDAIQRVYEYFSFGTEISGADMDSLSALLSQMGVSWTDVPGLLLTLLRREICNALDPDGAPSRKLALVVEGLNDHPAGRMPRHQGDEIERDVVWWYRLRVKNPADTVGALTKEYVESANRVTEAHSVVQNGLLRAHNLLNGEIRKKQPPSPT